MHAYQLLNSKVYSCCKVDLYETLSIISNMYFFQWINKHSSLFPSSIPPSSLPFSLPASCLLACQCLPFFLDTVYHPAFLPSFLSSIYLSFNSFLSFPLPCFPSFHPPILRSSLLPSLPSCLMSFILSFLQSFHSLSCFPLLTCVASHLQCAISVLVQVLGRAL